MSSSGIDFHWLEGKPSFNSHTTELGAPWPQGQVFKSTSFALTDAEGKGVPVQSAPLAYWPDGSLKWSGHSIPPNSGLSDKLTLTVGTPIEPQYPVTVENVAASVVIATGNFRAVLNTSGSDLFASLSLDGVDKALAGRLVLQFQDKPDNVDGLSAPNITQAYGNIEKVEVEKSGPVRAVVKVTGKYNPQNSDHAPWLPFTARLIVGAGGSELRIVHYFIFDGDSNKDFIKGLGLEFMVPFKSSEKLWDRHVRFASSDGGVWGESVNVLTGLRRDVTVPVSSAQFNGTPTPDTSTWPTSVTPYLGSLPAWNDFSLNQLDADSFSIWKREGDYGCWLKHAGRGSRAAGLGYIGGAVNGGIVFSERDFWEMYPRSLDIRNAAKDNANVTIWAYSPAGDAMDMRHYTNVDHKLELAYEDNPNPAATSIPNGVARSYEISLRVTNSTPSREDIGSWGKQNSAPPQLMASPEFYASRNLFGGRWGVPNSNLPMEKKQSKLLDFYVAEIDQQKWYGFWDFGDVMHTYDSIRHTWRYDVGGYAWDNAELGTDLWLWFSFLRTGRADLYRVAHAMTRHLTESDFYHSGTFVGIGSRHNVVHWGDGAKEARVAGSHLKRPMYYLSGGDETLGDFLRISLQADNTLIQWEALRSYLPKPAAPTRVRIGPDWTALVGNWLTEWERTGNTFYRDRIATGMTDIGNMPNGLFTGYTAAVGFDPATGHLTPEENTSESFTASYHLTMLFGGGELLMEVVDLIKVDVFDKAWLEFCHLYSGTKDEQTARYGKSWNSGGFYQLYAKLLAYAGQRRGDQALIDRAWKTFNANKVGVWPEATQIGGTDVIVPVKEIKDITTNDSASLSLTYFALTAIYPSGEEGFAPAQAQQQQSATLTELDDSASTIAVPWEEIVNEKQARRKAELERTSLMLAKKKVSFWGKIKRMLGI